MDQIDQKLLSILQQNARMPLESIAAQVFLSAPAVSARIEKLEAQGLIVGYHAEINQQKLGYPMLIKVAFPSTLELDSFIGELSRFGNTSTQIVFSTPVPPRNLVMQADTEKQPL